MTKKPYPSESQERFIVRLPDGMRDRIAETAKANNRSMNAEIVGRLEGSFAPAIDAERVRTQLLLKDYVIDDLLREVAQLEHSLLLYALMIERLKDADPTLLLGRFEELAESVRDAARRSLGNVNSGIVGRPGMTPQLSETWRDAISQSELGMAQIQAAFAADPDKVLDLYEREPRPSLEQLRALPPRKPSQKLPSQPKQEELRMGFGSDLKTLIDDQNERLNDAIERAGLNAGARLRELLGDDYSLIKAISLDAAIGKVHSVDAPHDVIEKIRAAGLLRD